MLQVTRVLVRGWAWTRWRAPKSFLRRLIAQSDNQIGVLELVGVVLTLSTFGEWLSENVWTAWVDNQGALGALVVAPKPWM